MNSKAVKILLVAAAVVALGGVVVFGRIRAQQNKMSVSTSFIMDTVIEQKLFGAQSQRAVAEIEERLQEYEQQFSMYVPDSQISRINQNAGKQYIEVSQECLELLQRAISFSCWLKARITRTPSSVSRKRLLRRSIFCRSATE